MSEESTQEEYDAMRVAGINAAQQAAAEEWQPQVDALAKVATSHERVMNAARIDLMRGDPNAAGRLLLEQLDGFDGPEWDGRETGMKWLERTRNAQARGGDLTRLKKELDDALDGFHFERKQVVALRTVLGEMFTCAATGDMALFGEDQLAEWSERSGVELPQADSEADL